jgi:cell division protein FtsI/penicillin-binding protein 2
VRNVIAGFVAVLIVVGAGVGAWMLLAPRLSGDSGDTAQDAAAAFATALAEGSPLDELTWTGAEEVAAVRASLVETLEVSALTVAVGEVRDVADGEAEADLHVTVVESILPAEFAWQSTIDIERRRGRWRVAGGAGSLHPELRPGWGFGIEQDADVRAPILDHTGVPLTGSGTVHVIGIEPRRVRDENRLLTTWASTLPESLQDLVDLLARSDLQPTWFYPITTISSDRFEGVWRSLQSVPGVIQREDAGSIRADGAYGRHILGRVGEPTAEMVEQGFEPGSQVGLYGLERVYEDQVTGSPATRVVIVEADGDVHSEIGTVGVDAPTPVTTTLDAVVQEAIENALAAVGTPAAIVALDVETGGIRGTASRPTGGYNRAWEGQYPPGDALLPLVAEAALAGGVGYDDRVTCPAEETVVGARLTAPADLGEVTVAEAFGAGCDTSVGLVAADLDEGALSSAAQRFGFGLAYDLPLPAIGGTFPEPIDRTEQVRAAVGQARVLASPLHLAAQLTGIDGTWNQPHLIPDEPGETAELTTGARTTLEQVLRAGVGDTGSAADLSGLGRAVAGTSVHNVAQGATTHAWVVGVDDSSQVAFAVLVEEATDPEPALRIAAQFLRELAALRG